MEAAQTLNFSRSAVAVRDGAVTIDGLVIDDRTLVELVERRVEQGLGEEETLRQAIEIGARVLDREATAAEVDFVKREFEKVSGEVERSFADRAKGITEELDKRLAAFLDGDGGVVAQVLDAHATGLSDELAKHFGGDRNTAVQNQVRELVAKQLADSRQELLRQFSAEDGHNPLADFKASVTKAIDGTRGNQESLIVKLTELQGEIKRLHDASEAAADLEAERDRGTAKGRAFEERAFEVVEQLAEARGDVARGVGDERAESGGKKGDVVIEIEAVSSECKGRIVIETKDEKLSKPEAWRVLDASLSDRDADFAILLVASEDELPARTEPLHEYGGNKMIVTLDKETLDARPLELAYRYARLRCLMTRERSLEVDAAGVHDAAEEALSALKDAQKIRLSLTSANKGVDDARQVLDDMIARVKAKLEHVETLISAAE